MTRSMTLERFADKQLRNGAFDSLHDMLRAAQLLEPTIEASRAFYTFAPPIRGTKQFAVVKEGSRWYLGI